MSKTCLIISGGDFSPFSVPEGALVIACDRGYDYARRCGVTPDLVVGDFDSLTAPVDSGVPVMRFRPEKDDTDTLLAIRIALSRGCDRLELVCALGGRLDHLLANLQAAVFAAEQGAAIRIESPSTEIHALRNGSLTLPRREGFSLSVFAASDLCRGVSISGAKYSLRDAELTNRFPLGVSNEWAGPEAEIRVREGILLIVLSQLN